MQSAKLIADVTLDWMGAGDASCYGLNPTARRPVCPPGVKGKQAADVQVSPVRLLVQSQMARNDEGKEMTQMGVGNLIVVTEL